MYASLLSYAITSSILLFFFVDVMRVLLREGIGHVVLLREGIGHVVLLREGIGHVCCYGCCIINRTWLNVVEYDTMDVAQFLRSFSVESPNSDGLEDEGKPK